MAEISDAQVQEFEERGYLVLDSGLDDSTLDAVVRDTAGMWRDLDSVRGRIPYAEANRLQDAWKLSPAIRAVATSPHILAVLQRLYQRKPLPFQTLNFRRGTEQRPHADSIHFNSEPFGLMCGVWIALENIGMDQGPLMYYPGTHRLPEMNFEDLGLDADYAAYTGYEDRIAGVIQEHGIEPEYACIEKGQALIWSANILHGGAPQVDKSRSRLSQVTHYYFEGARYWRPGYSEGRRYYFEPNWIPHPGGPAGPRFWRRVKFKLMDLLGLRNQPFKQRGGE